MLTLLLAEATRGKTGFQLNEHLTGQTVQTKAKPLAGPARLCRVGEAKSACYGWPPPPCAVLQVGGEAVSLALAPVSLPRGL